MSENVDLSGGELCQTVFKAIRAIEVGKVAVPLNNQQMTEESKQKMIIVDPGRKKEASVS